MQKRNSQYAASETKNRYQYFKRLIRLAHRNSRNKMGQHIVRSHFILNLISIKNIAIRGVKNQPI